MANTITLTKANGRTYTIDLQKEQFEIRPNGDVHLLKIGYGRCYPAGTPVADAVKANHGARIISR